MELEVVFTFAGPLLDCVGAVLWMAAKPEWTLSSRGPNQLVSPWA